MTPVIPCSASRIPFISGVPCTNRRTRVSSTSIRVVFHPLRTVRLLPEFGAGYLRDNISRLRRPTATGTDLEVEQESDTFDDSSTGSPEEVPFPVEGGEPSSIASVSDATSTGSNKSRTIRSQMPPVKKEELIPGAVFTGKVVAIQPFGAFVDIGAYTDGLVHISRMSDGFVKNIGDFVALGQEVKVRLVEVNAESGRISLSMRENDDKPKPQPRKDSGTRSQNANQRKESGRKISKLVTGQDLVGIVKNVTRSGSYVSLLDGEEGFLPTSEEELEDEMEETSSGSSLMVGQEIEVRVLRVAGARVTLTMKIEEEDGDLEPDDDDDDDDGGGGGGGYHLGNNPFAFAFHENEFISSYLIERAKLEEAAQVVTTPETPDVAEGIEIIPETEIKAPELLGRSTARSDDIIGGLPETETETEAPELLGQSATRSDDIVGVSTAVNSIDNTLLPVDNVVNTVPDNDDSIPSVVWTLNEDSVAQISSSVAGQDVVMETRSEVTVPKGNDVETSRELYDPPSAMQAEKQTEALIRQQNGSTVVVSQETSEVSSTGSVAEVAHQLESVGSTDPSGDIASSEATFSSQKLKVEESAEEQNKSEKQEDQVQIQAADTTETSPPTPADDKSDGTPNAAGVVVITNGPTVLESSNESSAKDQLETVGTIDSSGDAAPSEVTLSSQTLIVKETAEEIKSENQEDQVQIQAADTSETSSPTPAADKSDGTADDAGVIVITNGQTVVQSSNEISVQLENAGNNDPSGYAASTEAVFSSQELIVEEIAEQIKSEKQEDQVPMQAAHTNESSPTTPAENKSAGTLHKAATISPTLVKQLREETGAGMMDCKKALSETDGDIIKALEYLRKKGLAGAEKKASRTTAEGRIGAYIHDNRIGVLIEVNCETDFVSRGEIFKELVDDLAMQVAACPQVNYLVTEDVPEEIVAKEKSIETQKEDLLSKPEQIREKIVEGRIRKRLAELALLEQPFIKNDKVLVKDWVKQTIATIAENIKVRRFVRYNLGEGLEKKSLDFAAEVAAQTAVKESSIREKDAVAVAEVPKSEEKPSSVTVSASLVKQLREETGAGMMDCKKALAETGGNIEKAQEYLRKKGLSAADKKSSRLAAEGRIGSYIHDSRIGVLVEVNSETDFVARGDNFKSLVDDLAMQIVACPQVKFVSIEDIPEDVVRKEKEIEMQREDILSKPENLRERIVDGRVSKRLGELALLEQPFIKDDSLLVKDLVKQTVAALGENIRVRRFVRFTLGEELEDVKAEAKA
ncbi:Polyprotein of EF-Ts, chloroplastic-like protein [Drosera capensis]